MSISEIGKSFAYVFIPADLNQPIEERRLEMPPGKEVECLTNELKTHFQGIGSGCEQSQPRRFHTPRGPG